MILIGMGCVILLKIAYKHLTYILCQNNEINRTFKQYYKNGMFNAYDRILVTDLQLNKENLDIIKRDTVLRRKFILFDHNESVAHFNSYEFVNIIVKNKNGDCCSTSLLYDHLLSLNLIKKTDALDVFCEATRISDTGAWQLQSENELPRDLSLLFDAIGTERYITNLYEKLKQENYFMFNYDEQNIIKLKRETTNEKVSSYIKNIRFKYIDGYKAGIIFISYEYRNEIAQYLRITNMYNIDLVILVAVDKNSISIRNVNPKVNVRPIAEKMGGKGHFGAAGCNIDVNNFTKVLKVLL